KERRGIEARRGRGRRLDDRLSGRNTRAAHALPGNAALVFVAQLDLGDRRLDEYLALRAGEHLVEELLDLLVLLGGRADVEHAALAAGDDGGRSLVDGGRLGHLACRRNRRLRGTRAPPP